MAFLCAMKEAGRPRCFRIARQFKAPPWRPQSSQNVGWKTQGLEESLASSACAISAIKLCTDDCSCHPRTVLALLQVDRIGGSQEVLFGADVSLPIKSKACEGCLRNVSH